MVNKIIQGVAAALKSIGYPIYQDNVEQGLCSPCFFIATLAPSMVRNPGKVTILTVPLDVHYFPVEEGNNADISDMMGNLMLLLDVITLPDGTKARGTARSCETQDGVLHCFVTYQVAIKETAETPNMEELHLEEGTENG